MAVMIHVDDFTNGPTTIGDDTPRVDDRTPEEVAAAQAEIRAILAEIELHLSTTPEGVTQVDFFNANHDKLGKFAKAGTPGSISGEVSFQGIAARTAGGGASYQVVAKVTPTSGYMVSPFLGREEVHLSSMISPKNVELYVQKNMDLLSQPGHYLGTWVDSPRPHYEGSPHPQQFGDPLTYLDVSIRVTTLEAAGKLARKHSQLGVFDLEAALRGDDGFIATTDLP